MTNNYYILFSIKFQRDNILQISDVIDCESITDNLLPIIENENEKTVKENIETECNKSNKIIALTSDDTYKLMKL